MVTDSASAKEADKGGQRVLGASMWERWGKTGNTCRRGKRSTVEKQGMWRGRVGGGAGRI